MKQLILVSLFFFLLLPMLYAQEQNDCVKLTGSYIFRESPDEGKAEAIKLALARGIIEVLSDKIPLQFLRAKYAVIRREFINQAREYLTELNLTSQKVKGHRIYVTVCVRWDDNKITQQLEKLSIVPSGILPPPIKLTFSKSSFPSWVSSEEVKDVLNNTLKKYGFPVTNRGFRYVITVKTHLEKWNSFPLYVTPQTTKFIIEAYSIDKKFSHSLSFYLVYPFVTTYVVVNKVRELLPQLLELVRLDWFKNLRKLEKFSFVVPSQFISEAMKIFTMVVKNSAKTSLLRIGMLTRKGLWLVDYHTGSFSDEDVVKEINNIIQIIGLKLVAEGRFYKVETYKK